MQARGLHPFQEFCEEQQPHFSICKLWCQSLYWPINQKHLLCPMADFLKKLFIIKERNPFSNCNKADVFLSPPLPTFYGLKVIMCKMFQIKFKIQYYYQQKSQNSNHVSFLYWHALFTLSIYNKIIKDHRTACLGILGMEHWSVLHFFHRHLTFLLQTSYVSLPVWPFYLPSRSLSEVISLLVYWEIKSKENAFPLLVLF